ncbi:MAG: ABC transporter substrate-binding protein [Lachnospiraceae bacterium]|nr:ABC transporter substrate-binding protein [Lachnospiraceae bacterium]
MKKFKAIGVAVLALVMAAALCACGGGNKPAPSGSGTDAGEKSMTYTLIYGNNEGDEVALVAQSLKDQWEEAFPGVTINLQPMTKAERLEKMQNDNYTIALTRWGPDYADPMTYLGMWTTGTANNYGFWSNADYDALIKSCSSGELAGDYDARWAALYDAEKLVMDDAVIAPLYTKANANLIADGVEGVEFHPVALNRVYKRATSATGTLNVMFATNVMSLDTNLATDGDSFEIIADCIDGLTQMDADGAAQPAIAESWDISDDQMTYTFHLRKDATWNNGTPVTAKDFEFAWKLAMTANVEYNYMFDSTVGCVKNADAVLYDGADPETLGVKALDDYTLEVQLEAPVSFFPSLMYFPTFYPINQAFYESVGADNYGTSPETFLSNGAFMLSEYTPGTASPKVVKNPGYYDAASVQLQGINYQVVDGSDNALTAFKNATLDIAVVSGDQVKAVKDDATLSKNLKVTGAGYMWYVTFSQTVNADSNGDFANKNLRLAFTNAIDREFVVDNYVMDGSLATFTCVPPQFAASATTGEDFSADQSRFADVCAYNLEAAQGFFETAASELGY